MSIDGNLRVTIQGEVMETHFGTREIALQSLERYTTACLLHGLLPPKEPKPEWREIMDQMSRHSTSVYRKLVYETPAFEDLFLKATPIRELGVMNIGSRPAYVLPGFFFYLFN